MNKRQILIGFLALLAGSLVYLADRPPGATWFVQQLPFLSLHGSAGGFLGAAGWSLPAFSHVLAMTLLTAGVLGCGRTGCILVCLGWLAADVLFELGQAFPGKASALIPDWFSRIPLLDQTPRYFTQGHFQIMDLAAIAAGGAAAMAILFWTANKQSA